jgi:hypothetical protein
MGDYSYAKKKRTKDLKKCMKLNGTARVGNAIMISTTRSMDIN